MKRVRLYLSASWLLLLSFGTLASVAGATRPVVAVVLAGGGAKGAAHIGVLKALEELRVPVDRITGTSMGAYIGGLYATGIDANELKQLVENVDWNSGYIDRVNRSERRVRDKEFEDRYELNTDLGLSWEMVSGAKGVVQGQNMLRILRDTVGNRDDLDSFDQLAIPFRAVATDIINLTPVVLDEGYLVDAMMASMSVPGVLPPYEVDGLWLVDGGVTDNLPVDVAREMGADVVIAVDISTDYKKQEDFTTFLAVADQLSNYLVRQSTLYQVNTLKPTDIYLKPDVGQMETVEFDKMSEAYDKGYQAVMNNRDKFTKLALSKVAFERYQQGKLIKKNQLHDKNNISFGRVIVENKSHYSNQVLQDFLRIEPHSTLSSEQIENRIQALYALDRFELITYRLEKDSEMPELDEAGYSEEGNSGLLQQDLVIDVKEKSWGPNYLNFRFALEDDFNSESQYSIGASSNFTDLGENGRELRLDLEMGTDKLIKTELYSPLASDQKWFNTITGSYRRDRRSVPDSGFSDTSLSASENYQTVIYSELGGETALGYQPTLWSEVSLGVRLSDGNAILSNLPSLGDTTYTRKGVFLRYRFDTLDNYGLPNNGLYIDVEYLLSHDQVDSTENAITQTYDENVYEFTSEFIAAKSLGRHTLVANADYGVVGSNGSIVPINPKTIGGFLNLSGIPKNRLIGKNKVFTSLVYRYRWFDNDFGLFTSPVYLGGSLEYGGVWSDESITLSNAPLYTAGSLFTGVDSPLGPIMLGYGRTQDRYDSVYLILGNVFK
jgi:NTE family protein